jgi:hypothetical protein
MPPLNIVIVLALAAALIVLLGVMRRRRRAAQSDDTPGARPEPAAPVASGAGASWVIGTSGPQDAPGAALATPLVAHSASSDDEPAGTGPDTLSWLGPPRDPEGPVAASRGGGDDLADTAEQAFGSGAAPAQTQVPVAPAMPAEADAPPVRDEGPLFAQFAHAPEPADAEPAHADPPPPEPAPETAVDWGAWEAPEDAAGGPAQETPWDREPALAAAEQSAALTWQFPAVGDAPSDGLATPDGHTPAIDDTVPDAGTTAAEVAWWDVEVEVPEASPDEAESGYFATGGYAVFRDQPFVSGVTFRRPLRAAPHVHGADIELVVEGVLNCAPEGVEVVRDEGFAPTAEGFSLRVRALAPGEIMVRGSYTVR